MFSGCLNHIQAWFRNLSHLQNPISDSKKRQGTTSVVPKDDQKDIGL
jgi:hypothetical protein